VYYIYISPSNDDEWNYENVLGYDILGDGYSVDIQLRYPLSSVDTYDFCVGNLHGDIYFKDKVKITSNARIVFSGDEDEPEL
jgi:hypothetical protein